MFPYLRAAGFDPKIVFEPEHATETPKLPADLAARLVADGFQIIYFQKVHGPYVENMARVLRTHGIRTVYGVCDLVQETMADFVDATVVVTDYLKSLYPRSLWPKIHVVHDGIEHPEVEVLKYRDDPGSSNLPLRAILVTSSNLDHLPVLKRPPPWLELEIIGRYPAARPYIENLRHNYWTFLQQKCWRDRLAYLNFVANRRIKRIPWDPQGVYDRLRRADIGIIPIDMEPPEEPNSPVPSWKVKSENRLTMKMCVGLPVIATRIPSYEPVIEHGRNGFFAHSRKEWLEYLQTLRDPQLRKSIGMAARKSVIDRYSMQSQAEKLIKVLRALVQSI
ncbi:MAG: glycosyltransferase family protein [Pseudomonadota bacterium]